MADTVSKRKRSQVMAAIRGRGNKATELKLATILRAARITGWRRHALLPGRPDFVFHTARLALFVDGCFWHGCNSHCRIPKSRVAYWQTKITGNKLRDRAVSRRLRRMGWRVQRLWEHALRDPIKVANEIRNSLVPKSAQRKASRYSPTSYNPSNAKTRKT